MRRRKKRLFAENGQEYYQIEPLAKMTPLKTFNLVQNSINKLAVNIETKGISNAIMKLGQQLVYEEVDEMRKNRKRVKKGFAALSDDNEETKGEDCGMR